jgi:signal transduction histidine kinase
MSDDRTPPQVTAQHQVPLGHCGLADQLRNAESEDELLTGVVRLLVQQTAADWVAVYLADERNKKIEFDPRYVSVRPGSALTEAAHYGTGVREVSWKSGVLGRAARSKEGYLIFGKAQALDLTAKDVSHDFGRAESAVALPIVAEGATVAILVAGRYSDVLAAEDILLLQLVQAAAAAHWSRIALARNSGAANKPLQKLLQGLPDAAEVLRLFLLTYGRGEFLKSLARLALALIRAQGCLILTFEALTSGLFGDGCYFYSEGNTRPVDPNDHSFREIVLYLRERRRVFIEHDLSDFRSGPLVRLLQEFQYRSCLVIPTALFSGRDSFLLLLSRGRSGFGKVEKAIATLAKQLFGVLAVAHEAADTVAYAQRTSVLAHQFAEIVHQVRNYAVYASSYLEYLQEDLDELAKSPPTPEMAKPLARLVDHANIVSGELAKLQKHIEILRNPGRRGEVKLSVRKFNLNELIADIRRSLFDLSKAKEIKIDFKPDRAFDERSYLVTSDPDLLRECVSNVLLNAIYFTPQGGPIEVGTRFNADHPSYQVAIYVKDKGGGIHRSDIDKIFEPFYSTKKTALTELPDHWGGTGLGLFLTKNNLVLLGGEIRVESYVPTGSTFTIYLPFRY